MQHHTIYMCAKAFGSSQTNPKMPKSCESSEHAGVRSLHGTSEWSAEISSRTACRNHAEFQGDWHQSFEPYSWSSTRTFIILCPTPNQTRAFQSRQNKMVMFGFTLQERDEHSEVARMHALEEKYKAEVSQLAKDSRAVSSVASQQCHISTGDSMALFGTVRMPKNAQKYISCGPAISNNDLQWQHPQRLSHTRLQTVYTL